LTITVLTKIKVGVYNITLGVIIFANIFGYFVKYPRKINQLFAKTNKLFKKEKNEKKNKSKDEHIEDTKVDIKYMVIKLQ